MSARAFGKMAMGAVALSILLAEGGCVVPVIGLAGTAAVKATEDRGIGGAACWTGARTLASAAVSEAARGARTRAGAASCDVRVVGVVVRTAAGGGAFCAIWLGGAAVVVESEVVVVVVAPPGVSSATPVWPCGWV